jgi:predicted transcriptional regulator
MPLERREVEDSLTKKGFVSSAGDHKFFVYVTLTGSKTSVRTKTSHGTSSKTLSDHLVSTMAKQCGLNTGQFRRLVDCPLSQADYEEILLNSGRIAK